MNRDITDSDSSTGSDTPTGSTDSSASTTTSSTTDESEEVDFHPTGGDNGNVIKNRPHDEEFSVGAPSGGGAAAAPSRAPAPATSSGGGAGGATVQNMPHDEEFDVTGGRPTGASEGSRPPPAGGGQRPVGTVVHDDQHDEFVELEDDMEDTDDDVPTPQKGPVSGKPPAPAPAGGALGGKQSSDLLRDQAHDESFTVSKSSAKAPEPLKKPPMGSPAKATTQSPQRFSAQPSMAPPDDSDDTEETGSDSDDDDDVPRMGGNQKPGPVGAAAPGPTGPVASQAAEYNPADYAHITASVPPDVRDLFLHITAYQPTVIECPAKLRPFIPDYIPSVGDIDTFCKVPRPDDKTDNYGLAVVDEPSSRMSNPTIVTTVLTAGEPVSSDYVDKIMDSLEGAADRPQAIDHWIDELRNAQSKRAAPTVYYSKPMPSIETLMQEWPQGFEEILNSDLQLPPPGIDLDMEQYVRMLCAVLDVPVHNNLIESLHVMFTLYLEFRENQHFKAAA